MRLGYVWMTLGVSALIIWFVLMFIPYERILPFTIQNWYRSGSALLGLSFAVNVSNWPVVFALMAFHILFLFTAATQPELNRDFIFWIVEAGEVALSYAVLTSSNLITVILTWTALDVSGLLYHIFLRDSWDIDYIFYPFIFKLAGSLLLVFTNAELVGSGQNTILENLPVSSSAMLFFSALLHSGIFPYRPFKQDKRLIVTIVDFSVFFLPFIVSLFLITSLPMPNFPLVSTFFLSLVFLLIFINFSPGWFSKEETLQSIHQLLFSFIGLIGFLFFMKNESSVIHWFVILIIGVNYLLLYYRRSKALRIFTILMLLSFTGLPFSLTGYSFVAFDSIMAVISAIGLIAFHIVFNVGFIRLVFKEKEAFEELDASYQIIYMAGLGIAILSLGVVTFRTLGSLLDEFNNWWMGILVFLTTLGLYFRYTKNETTQDAEKVYPWRKKIVDLLTFQWFYKASDYLVQAVRTIVSTFSQLLEGEGGVLWSIVLLALLFTMLKIGQG